MPQAVAELYNTLTLTAQQEVYDFMMYLAQKQKNTIKTTLDEINEIFKDDKGWNSEEEMLADMAEFRRKRLAKCEY